LWRFGLHLDFDGVDDLVRRLSAQACAVPGTWGVDFTPAGDTARLGDDGRYHLCDQGRPLCASRRTLDPQHADKPVPHEQWCHWWTDTQRYRVQAPADAWDPSTHELVLGTCGDIRVRWSVRLDEQDVLEPSSVPARLRCRAGDAATRWPGFSGATTKLGQLTARLVRQLGALCHACGKLHGAVVDHDHFSGLVRGHLCIVCNPRIDFCTHVDECQFATYLNHPPASALGLLYPRSSWERRTELDLARIAHFGFNPLYRGPSRPAVH
jgi:hypothetical protein